MMDRMEDHQGKPLRLDANAASASPDLPAFLSRPADAPVYHGFMIVPETWTDGWVFGTISEYADPNGCEWGDAFVVAPDGSRAGIMWSVGERKTSIVCPPDAQRWGVYGVGFPKMVRTTADFVECCRAVLPELKAIWATLRSGA
jgi:hypothetical protein